MLYTKYANKVSSYAYNMQLGNYWRCTIYYIVIVIDVLN